MVAPVVLGVMRVLAPVAAEVPPGTVVSGAGVGVPTWPVRRAEGPAERRRPGCVPVGCPPVPRCPLPCRQLRPKHVASGPSAVPTVGVVGCA